MYKYEDFKNELDESKGLIEKVVYIDGYKISMFCHLFQYDGLFSNKIIEEFRGTTFVDEKECFLGLHKFFNIDQVDSTMYNIIKNKKIVDVTEKVDGSYISSIIIGNKIYMKSKLSINESTQSKNATEIVNSNKEYKDWIMKMYKEKLHPSFEYVSDSEEEQVILNYDKKELYLLQIRDSEGNYLDIKEFDHPFKERESFKFNDIDEIIRLCEDLEDKEGFVVRFEDGQMIKVKTKWYFERHCFYEDNFNEKAIFLSILDETIDDILSAKANVLKTEQRDKIEKYSYLINRHISERMEYIKSLDYSGDKKDIALKYKKDNEFGSIMIYNSKGESECLNSIKSRMKIKYNGLVKVIKFIDKLGKYYDL